MNMARHDPDLALTGRDDAGAVRPDQAHADEPIQGSTHLQHIHRGNAFGNAGNYLDAGIGRFQNGIGRKGRRYVNHAGGCTRLAHSFIDSVKNRQPKVLLTTAARGHAPNQFGAIGQRLLRMESALLAGKALADHFSVFVDQNTHVESSLGAYLLTAATTCLAASVRLSAGIRFKPLLASSSLP